MGKVRGVVMALVLGLLLIVGVSPSKASAACYFDGPWLHNPMECNNIADLDTVYKLSNAELKSLYVDGHYYYWGQFALNGDEPGAELYFDVDLNSDGQWDRHRIAYFGGSTAAHESDVLSDVKFRINIHHGNGTWETGPWVEY